MACPCKNESCGCTDCQCGENCACDNCTKQKTQHKQTCSCKGTGQGCECGTECKC